MCFPANFLLFLFILLFLRDISAAFILGMCDIDFFNKNKKIYIFIFKDAICSVWQYDRSVRFFVCPSETRTLGHVAAAADDDCTGVSCMCVRAAVSIFIVKVKMQTDALHFALNSGLSCVFIINESNLSHVLYLRSVRIFVLAQVVSYSLYALVICSSIFGSCNFCASFALC